jgi:hypothetical protein
LVSRNKPKINQNRLGFGLNRNFLFVSWTPYFLYCFLFFFRFVSKQIYLFRLFLNGLKIPNRIKKCLVSRNKPKISRNRFCFVLFRFESKMLFVCFANTLVGGKDKADIFLLCKNSNVFHLFCFMMLIFLLSLRKCNFFSINNIKVKLNYF